jgi:hypothetical protein
MKWLRRAEDGKAKNKDLKLPPRGLRHLYSAAKYDRLVSHCKPFQKERATSQYVLALQLEVSANIRGSELVDQSAALWPIASPPWQRYAPPEASHCQPLKLSRHGQACQATGERWG